MKRKMTQVAFSVFWDRFLMISGSNLGGLPLPEHLWNLLAEAGGSPMLQSVIFDDFGFRFGSLRGHFLDSF